MIIQTFILPIENEQKGFARTLRFSFPLKLRGKIERSLNVNKIELLPCVFFNLKKIQF